MVLSGKVVCSHMVLLRGGRRPVSTVVSSSRYLRSVSRHLSSRCSESARGPSGLVETHRQLLQGEKGVVATVRGHIRSLRSSKNVGFIDVSDGSVSQPVNIVLRNPGLLAPLKVGQSIEVLGVWQESSGKQIAELFVDAENPLLWVRVVGDVPENYPLQKKSQSLSFLRGLPTLRHRTSTLASVLRFRSRVESILASVFEEHHFTKVAPPIITSSDCEGAGEQFKVEPLRKQESFFGSPSYLTVSSQLHLEILASSLNRVWTLSPCFRAEYSNTTRHLSEFYMLEAEISHVTDVKELVNFTEDMIRGVVARLQSLKQSDAGGLLDLASYKDESALQKIWDGLLRERRWPCITYGEAVDILNTVKAKGRLKGRLSWGDSILTEHEKWLAGTHFQSPVFITDYPKEQKPFYMPLSKGVSDTDEKKTVACYDLIIPEIGELVGGSLREHDLGKLKTEMERRGMDLEAMQWYLSTRENGSVPHGGFGLGFERLLAYLANVENIRDISAFPRAPNVCPC